MPEQLFTTGNELSAHQGNASLGYSSGVGYNGNPEIANPFATVNSALSQIQQEDAARREEQRKIEYEKQKALSQHLLETGQSLFNLKGENGKDMSFEMLPEDRATLNAAVDDYRRSLLAAQGRMTDPAIMAKRRNMEQLIAHAGIRAQDRARKEVMMANSNNPLEREAIQKNINNLTGTKVEDFVSPEPYLPETTYSLDKLIHPDIVSGKNKEAMTVFGVKSGLDADGNQVEHELSGISPNIIDFRAKIRPGSDMYDQAMAITKSFTNGPTLQDPQRLAQMNANIDQINAQRGYAPGSPHFIPHIADMTPNGQIVVNSNIRPEDVAYAVVAEHYGGLNAQPKIKKTALEIQEAKQKLYMDQQRNAREWKKLEQDQEELRQKGSALTAAERKQRESENEGKRIALTVAETLSDTSKMAPLSSVINNVPEWDASGFKDALGNNGIDPNSYNVSTLSTKSPTIRSIAAIQHTSPSGVSYYGLTTPTYAYLVMPKDGNIKNAKYVFGYPVIEDQVDANTGEVIYNEGGTKPKQEENTKWKVISPKEALNEYMKGDNNYKPLSEYQQSSLNHAHEYFDELFNGSPTQKQEINTDAVRKMISSGKGVTPIELEGETYYQIGDKYYRKNGQEIKQ